MALKILLADDNITAQKMGSKILTDAGYEVVAVSNGAAAMKKIASEKPDLLILDVYMPGYSGLEVCQKIKAAAATASVPVVLTVTNMEPFNPEDGNKVKADGVLVKPFEASDVLAIVQKFERKLQAPEPPPAEPEYEKTQKMAAVEFQDASYEEWKAEAPPEEERSAPQMVLSKEMGAAPALGMEDMLVEPAPPEPQAEAAPAFAAEAVVFETQPAEVPAPAFDREPAAAVSAEPAFQPIAPPPELEFTSAPPVGEVEIAPTAELELNGHAAAAAATEVPIVPDPALVTDASEMAQFVTTFGTQEAEPAAPAEQPAETAELAAIPEITEPAEAAAPPLALEIPVPEAPPEPAPLLEIPAVEEISAASLEQEMRRAFDAGGGVAAAPALAPEPAPAPQPEPFLEAAPFIDVPPAPAPVEPPPPEVVTDHLVAQFAAELEKVAPAETLAEEVALPAPVAAEAAPAPPAAVMDEQRVTEAVQRVLERYKDELVAAIVRELKS